MLALPVLRAVRPARQVKPVRPTVQARQPTAEQDSTLRVEPRPAPAAPSARSVPSQTHRPFRVATGNTRPQQVNIYLELIQINSWFDLNVNIHPPVQVMSFTRNCIVIYSSFDLNVNTRNANTRTQQVMSFTWNYNVIYSSFDLNVNTRPQQVNIYLEL